MDDFIKNIKNPHNLNALEKRNALNIFNYLSKVAKKNPGTVAKLAIAGGTLATMIIFLRKYQN